MRPASPRKREERLRVWLRSYEPLVAPLEAAEPSAGPDMVEEWQKTARVNKSELLVSSADSR